MATTKSHVVIKNGAFSSTAGLPAAMSVEEQTLIKKLNDLEDKSAVISTEFQNIVGDIGVFRDSAKREMTAASKALGIINSEPPRKRRRQDSELESDEDDDDEDTDSDELPTYRTAATHFAKLSDVLTQLQIRLNEVHEKTECAKKALLENHRKYKMNRDEWLGTMQKLSATSDRIDESTVLSALSIKK